MTTATLPDRAPAQPLPTSSNFAGTLYQLRLFFRRDRIVAPLWVLILGYLLPITYVKSIASVYPTEADRVKFATSTAASPAQIAMYGPIFNSSEGMVTIWKAGALFTMIGVAVILTVIRHTRVEEEIGRAELVESTATGRYSGLTAALALACGGSAIAGLLAAVALLSGGLPIGGSVGFGAALAGSGFVFAGVAAVAAQLSTGARTARGVAFAVLATTFALRAVGDAGSGQLSWLSPQGWSLQLRPYAGERWWVLLLHALTTAALIAAAYALLRNRDVGAGLIAERPGSPRASAALSGTVGLAWRIQRGTMIAWTVGLGIYALLIGSVAKGIGNEIGDSKVITDIIDRAGGPSSLEESLIGFGFTALGIAAAAYTISATLRLHSEEAADRGESILAGSIGRIRWALSHIVFALLGPAVALVVAGLAAGLAYGVATDDINGKLPAVLGAALVQLPAIWLLTGVTVALFGLAPRFTPVAWGVLVAFLLLFVAGSAANLPHAILDLEPFSQLPKLPGGDFVAAPILWLLLIDIALIAVGLLAFKRRDLR
ncbi:ABC transporter permease [Antrihabitans cavernicola]|uniref:ABC transporter permease n=1 Tax=Antrihabitans cavernicola TaxID=2495913 RepID=A0A5A7S8U2_9NOCA|nr:ABC transporter permease [Spelaeibacter cavernicola]KAA0022578.1 ABC transporter permease [Spelaeibacter cavernicola]